MKKKVEWTIKAFSNLQEIKNYISEKSEKSSKLIEMEILEKVDNLQLFPEIGRVVPEYDEKLIREIFVYSFRVIYKVKENYVIILFIAYMRKDLDKDKKW